MKPSKRQRVVEGDVCWFCKRPADGNSWQGLGKLLRTHTVQLG
jgi:hypothetical protein